MNNEGYPAPPPKKNDEPHQIDWYEFTKWTLIVGFIYSLIGYLFF